MAAEKRTRQSKSQLPAIKELTPSRTSPLVFISHDTRDADLAEAFGNLLTDASGGILQSFRSSDRKGTSGIEFGAEWYNSIMSKLDDATDVVALLTNYSMNRPWILYEAGVAKGKLETVVLGVAVGIKLEQTNTGPFAQFQNCGDDEDSLTKLVLQLIKRNPVASPREEAVRRQVQAFIGTIQEVIKARPKHSDSSKQSEDTSVAKMFEEVKILVRDLPSRVDMQLREHGIIRRNRKRRRMHPHMLEEMMMHPMIMEQGVSPTVGLLMFASTVRDDFPWFYELAADVHRAYQSNDEVQIKKAREALIAASEIMGNSKYLFDLGPGEEEEMYYMAKHMMRYIKETLPVLKPSTSLKKAAKEPQPGS